MYEIKHLENDIKTLKLQVTPDLRGCPRGKNSYARRFKGKHGKLHIVGKLNNNNNNNNNI